MNDPQFQLLTLKMKFFAIFVLLAVCIAVASADHHGKRPKPTHAAHSGTRHPGTHKPHHHHTRKPRDLENEPELRAKTRAPKPTHKPHPTHGPKPSAKPKPTRRHGPVAPSRKPTRKP